VPGDGSQGHGHVAVLELSWALVTGAGATGHVTVQSCPVARGGSRSHGARDRSGAVTGTGDESCHHEARGDSVVTPKLPCVRSQKP
jgi:hypothetical protein